MVVVSRKRVGASPSSREALKERLIGGDFGQQLIGQGGMTPEAQLFETLAGALMRVPEQQRANHPLLGVGVMNRDSARYTGGGEKTSPGFYYTEGKAWGFILQMAVNDCMTGYTNPHDPGVQADLLAAVNKKRTTASVAVTGAASERMDELKAAAKGKTTLQRDGLGSQATAVAKAAVTAASALRPKESLSPDDLNFNYQTANLNADQVKAFVDLAAERPLTDEQLKPKDSLHPTRAYLIEYRKRPELAERAVQLADRIRGQGPLRNTMV